MRRDSPALARKLGLAMAYQDTSLIVAEPVKKFTRFMHGNLLEQPTLTCFDAIVCRNVMIYFSREMHDVVIANLYNALLVDGYLMIGRTEALMGSVRGKFDVVDNENRILRKKK